MSIHFGVQTKKQVLISENLFSHMKKITFS